MSFKWKVCGMKNRQNIIDVLQFQPDYMGFIFYEKSPRYVGRQWDGPPEDFPDSTRKVGVFVNQDLEEVVRLVNQYQLDYLQLHGNESPGYCKELNAEGFSILKAVSLKESRDLQKLDAYTPWVNYFLFDTPSKQFGGTGRTFDWSLLSQYRHAVPFFLSGGLSLENLDAVAGLDGLNLWALDVNSRFEIEPGVKNISKLREFKNQLQKL
ncbi:MAG: N-(5'-phosphoribosyl)anthranilate isomerase [Cyclobacteriaceae bacterium]|nr:MAG: N-(5'-phosphoribosyl)anthranilate isomerase [Cyclobacteriaceae bacterium]